jgi:hypothetical protein
MEAVIEACLTRIRNAYADGPMSFNAWILEDSPWEFLEIFEDNLPMDSDTKDICFEHCRCLSYAMYAFSQASFSNTCSGFVQFAGHYLRADLEDYELWKASQPMQVMSS